MRKTFRKKSLRSRKTKKQLRRTRRRNRRLRGGTSNLDALRRELASDIHNIWVRNNPSPQMRCPGGGRASQGKCREDEQIDIAVDYDKLPPFWQNANNAAVDVALTAFAKFPNDRNGAGNFIHEKWMQNNSWERGSRPHLFVPFDELPQDEKDKDLNHYDIIKRYVDDGHIKLDEIQATYS